MASRRIAWSAETLVNNESLAAVKAEVQQALSSLEGLEALPESKRKHSPEARAVVEAFDRVARLA